MPARIPSHTAAVRLSIAMTEHRRPLIVALSTLLLLRSRFLHLPHTLKAFLLDGANPSKVASHEDLAQALQQLYTKEEDGSKTVLVPDGGRTVTRVSDTHH